MDGKCPDCGREVQDAEEEAYFFRLSKYADQRAGSCSRTPTFCSPRTRVNEMINNFIKPGLEDLCVSRTSFNWGIPVDFDPGHVVYVWVDALFNYIDRAGLRRTSTHRRLREVLARRRPLRRQGDRPLPLHHLARHAHERWTCPCRSRSSATAGCCHGRRQDVQVQGQRRRPLRPRASCYGVDALRFFLLRDVPLRLGRQLLQRAADPDASTSTSPTTSATSSPARPRWSRSTSAASSPPRARTVTPD